MTLTLQEALTSTGGVWHVPEGWRQGRGAYGGLVIGALIDAIEARIGDPARTVRSVTAEIPGAVTPGPAELRVEILRAGNSVTTARAALAQDGEIRAHAVAICATSRPNMPSWLELAPPTAPPPTALQPIPTGSLFPEFAQHFDYWIVEGAPATGGAATTLGWIRPRAPGAARGAPFVAAVIDAWYPATLPRFPEFRPMATIAFTLEAIGPVADLGDEPLLYRGVVPVCGDGYFTETRELWRADGRLVARNHQTFAIIK